MLKEKKERVRFKFFIEIFNFFQAHWPNVAWIEYSAHRLHVEFPKRKTILSANTPHAVFNGVTAFGTGKFCQKSLKFSSTSMDFDWISICYSALPSSVLISTDLHTHSMEASQIINVVQLRNYTWCVIHTYPKRTLALVEQKAAQRKHK